ncbi:armadillo repeat-containing protein 6 homolog isoform X2 [Hyposmocoma kahamanoa]|uniref:armadillo repeat-containing protein 6 homolog isoform X2 n=1 Tax=Hyposmocoma kahamanoa TaxID=1477025 RepID=UPI000E6D5EF1|nr:armadillo repeat-containing protein 6 homolog isoform X2 [Hyposmocoma kahamanoa]
MVRVITQDTYDEVVKENMEEFDMSAEEAIKEAIAQFEAQGVDLSNIMKDLCLGSGDDRLVSTTVAQLKELNKSDEDDEILKHLDILKAECNKDIAHRVRAGKDGVYKILIDLLEARYKQYHKDNEVDKRIVVETLNCLTALMDTQPDLLDDHGIDLIMRILEETKNEEVLIATLQWVTNCCIKHEINRQRLFAKNIAARLKILLSSKNQKLISECLQVIRKFTLDDDIRVEFGRAHEHARELGVLLLEPLMALLKDNTKPPLVSELMLTIATLLVRHELCKMASDIGVNSLFTVLTDNYDNSVVAQQANKLITALAGNDEVKRDLVKSGIVPIVTSLLTRHSNNAISTALTLKTIAALSLREPGHSKQFLDSGAPEGIVQCLKIHPNDSAVQKNACWAIRNLTARCREYNSKFHELGIEALLNAAYDKFNKDFGFDIKSALRDLDCNVKLDEQWTGKGVQMEQ